MTIPDPGTAATHDRLDDAPVSTSAPHAQRDELYTSTHDTAGLGTRGDSDLLGQHRPDVAGGGAVGGATEGGVLIADELAADYRARWTVVQGDFIDEPRKAVLDADAMVGEVLDRVAETFRRQREGLERGWADDKSSTEDLRIALRRYRTFFDRLLSL